MKTRRKTSQPARSRMATKRKKSAGSSKTVVSVVFLLLALFTTIVVVQSQQTFKQFASQSKITPTFNCIGLGSCDGSPTALPSTVGQLCSTNGDCAFGLVCSEQKCVVPSPTGDAGQSASDSGSTTASDSGSTTASDSATTNTCNSKYKLNTNPLGKNFGDPKCDFTKDKLYAQLKKDDPKNASKWFNIVIPCHSSFQPNEYHKCKVTTTEKCEGYDPEGMWGLFGMAKGGNGALDHGDVPWQQQATNAIGYNKELSSKQKDFAYWGLCTKSIWGPKANINDQSSQVASNSADTTNQGSSSSASTNDSPTTSQSDSPTP